MGFTISDYDRLIGSVIGKDVRFTARSGRRNPDLYPWIQPTTSGDFRTKEEKDAGSKQIIFYGLNFGDNLAFVPWVSNCVNMFQTNNNMIAVSFGFSGCYMAKFVVNGTRYITHIQSSSGGPSQDAKPVWNALVDKYELQVNSIFRPTDTNDRIYSCKKEFDADIVEVGCCCRPRVHSTDPHHTIAGVILPDNTCYAVLVDVNTHWAVMIKKIDPLSSATLLSC